MTAEDILKIRSLGEVSKVQFKERLMDKYDIGCELAAFSNTHGGQLIVGINDKTGEVNPLSYQEVQETTNLLSNIASENVVPGILLTIDTAPVEGGTIVVATIKEGLNKPYHDNKGIVWVKNGADKRKVFDNAELAEMMSECGSFIPDEAAVNNATIDDLDEKTLKLFLSKKFETVLKKKEMTGDRFRDASLDEVCGTIAQGHDKLKLLRNLHFIRPDGKLTIAAILLFAKYTQRWLPVMTAKCISFVGNSIGGSQFRDKVNDTDMEGNLLHQFETIMSFFTRNLKTVQVKKEFNSMGELEIPYTCLVELVVNALVHRSLNWKAPIRIFIFDNRIEIHSPGTLPNGLSVDDIVAGTSMPRNNFLFANAIYLLPYTGAGSGIQRAIGQDKRLSFSNNEKLHEFTIIIERDNVQVDVNLDTKKNNSDTNSDTFGSIPNTFEGDFNIIPNTSDAIPNTFSDTLDTIPNTSDKTPNTKMDKLSGKQKDVINFCSIPRNSREILERVGVKYHSSNIKRYITELVNKGFLERTIPDQPFDSNQKYRKRLK